MTVEHLKRHMDRRFDRLQRIKADKVDLKRFATKTQIRRIGKDLANCATKNDLKRFATKDDLKRFATKEDLKRFATKEDLKRFATKNDLERFATKEDLKRELQHHATKDELQILAADMSRQFTSLSDKVDSVLHHVKDLATLNERLFVEHDLRLKDLEQRVGL
jgi:hypothetical protein